MKETKKCFLCKEEKPRSEFGKNRAAKDGLTSSCKPCSREYSRKRYWADPEIAKARVAKSKAKNPEKYKKKAQQDRMLRKYGLSPDDYQALLSRQLGACAICKSADKSLVVDHCHTTDRVRGLLCGTCNSGIGLLSDNPEVLLSAAAYLSSQPGL